MSEVSLVQVSDDFSCYAPTDPDGAYLELRLVFFEVFDEDCATYGQAVAAVPDDGVVLDIGANVGLFTLFLKSRKPDATVLAFEPMPGTVDALRRNIELHELTGVTVYPMALGAEEDSSVEFTFYPQAPANSTRYPEQKNYDYPLLHGSTKVEIEMTTASSVLTRHPEPTRIDLVKIDVEGAEEEVLLGLAARDWARIQAFVLEVEDIGGRLENIRKLLEDHGYAVTANPAPLIPQELIRLFNVHAVRR